MYVKYLEWCLEHGKCYLMLTVINTDKFEFFSSPANLILNDPMCDFQLKVVMTETLSGRALLYA